MTEAALSSGPRLAEADAAIKWLDRRRFGAALFLSALAHGALIALLLAIWRPSGDEPVPLPAIPVTLVRAPEGQAGATGAGTGNSAASASPSAAKSETANAAPAPPQPAAAPQEPPRPQHTPAKAAPQPPEPAPSPARAPNTPALALRAVPEPVPPRKPLPPSQPKGQPPPHRPAQSPPPPHSVARAAPPRAAAKIAVPAATEALLRDGVGGPGRGAAGSGRSAVGTRGTGYGDDNYPEVVMRWISRFQHYPEAALTKKQEGTVVVGFRFTRGGTILDAWVEKSSGYPLLDRAAVAMVRAASPIPPVPKQDPCATCTMGSMPVRFSIGLFDKLFR